MEEHTLADTFETRGEEGWGGLFPQGSGTLVWVLVQEDPRTVPPPDSLSDRLPGLERRPRGEESAWMGFPCLPSLGGPWARQGGQAEGLREGLAAPVFIAQTSAFCGDLPDRVCFPYRSVSPSCSVWFPVQSGPESVLQTDWPRSGLRGGGSVYRLL